MPLIDDTDFKSREVAITYNQAGMDLVWNFVTTAGATTQTAVTPTTAGVYDWTHVGDGMYSMEIPASGGASINNDTEGFGYFTGICTGVLAWRSETFCFRAAALNNSLIDAGTTGLLGPATAGRTLVVDASGLADANTVKLGPTGSGTAQTARDVGASVLLSSGTGTGQLDFTSGVVKSNLVQILATALTETAGLLAGGFKKFFNVATPTGDLNSLPAAIPAANGGLPTVNASNRIAGIAGTKNTLDDLNDLNAAGIRTATGLASANLDTQLAAISAFIDTEVAAIKAKTDNLPADPASQAAVLAKLPTALVGGRIDASVGAMAADTLTSSALATSAAQEVADALLDRASAIEGYTVREAYRLILATCVAKLAGAATTTVTIRDIADTKNRVSATVDASGNRTAVTLDAT